MMRKLFTVTYEIVTPESAEDGDCAEHGFCAPGGWQFPLTEETMGDDNSLSLREAVDCIGGSLEDSGSWFTETDTDTDYSTGAETRRALHPPRSITPASYGRLKRLLGAR